MCYTYIHAYFYDRMDSIYNHMEFYIITYNQMDFIYNHMLATEHAARHMNTSRYITTTWMAWHEDCGAS